MIATTENYIKMLIKADLEKLHAFLHGAHLATNDDNAGGVLHQACHKIDDIFKLIERTQKSVLESALNGGL